MYAIMKNTQIFIECDFFSQTELMSDRNSGVMKIPKKFHTFFDILQISRITITGIWIKARNFITSF